MMVRFRALVPRRAAALLLVGLSVLPLLGGSCEAPPPPAPPRVSYDEKIAWILWLEDQRVLRDPSPAPAAPAPVVTKGRRPALAPPPDAVPDVVKLLADGDPRVRRRAAIAVGRVGLREGVDALLPIVGDSDPVVREAAAFGLGLLGDPHAAAALTPLLAGASDPASALVAGRAAEALGLIGERVLAQRASGAAPSTQSPAAVAFDTTATAAAVGAMVTTLAASAGVRAVAPDEMRAPLAPEVEAFRLGLYALVRLKSYDQVVRAVLDERGQPTLRWWPAAYALQRLEDPRTLPALVALLRADGAYAAAFAARGLGALKDPRAVEPLLAAIKDPRPAVRFRAVESLGRLGDRRAAAPVLALLEQPSLDPTLRLAAVATLGQVKATEAYDVLLDQLSDGSPLVRISAQRALASIDPVAFVTVLSGMDVDSDWTVRAALAETLAALDSPTIEPRLRAALDDPDQRAIPAALRALVRAKAAGMDRVLLERLRSEDLQVRATAARLLGELKPAGAAPALVEASRAAAADTVSDVREAIVGALAELKAPETTEIATRLLADRDWSTRLRAAAILTRLDPGSAAGPVRPAPLQMDRAGYATLTAPPVSPHVFIDTARGAIEIELAVLDAPMTCHNFVTLARKGYFNGLRFHRVLGDFVAQAGDPRGDGSGGPGYSIRDELNDLPYLRGTIGMALSGPDTGGSQFFIARSPQPHLDAKYTVFARVVTGMEVVDRLQQWDTIQRVRVWDGVTMSLRD